MPPPGRTLVRYEQLRRTEPIGTEPLDDGKFAKGRYFQADCLATDVIGDFVYITGPAVLTIPQVTKVDIKTAGKFPSTGMILEKSTATRCMVIVFGEIAVSPATLIPGKVYWIGADSKITDIVPVPGVGEIAATQSIGYAIDTGRLLIEPARIPTIRHG